MELFRFRHVALGCVGFIASLYFSYFHLGKASRLVLLSLSLLTAVILAVIYLITKKRSMLDVFIKYAPLCFFVALAMLVSLISFGRGENILKFTGTEREITAEVIEEKWEDEHGGIYIIRIEEVDGENVKCKAVLESFAVSLDKGNRIYMYGEINELNDNNYGFSEKSAYLDDGILVSLDCERIELVEGEIKEKDLFKRLNQIFDTRLKNNLNSDTYALFSALLLGNKDNLSSSVRRDFSRLGISHVLALSGMHITLLTALLSFVLSLFKIPKQYKLVLLILSIAIFVGITGFSDSAVRAGLMMTFYFVFRLIGKGTDSITSLFLSVTLILIALPYHIFSVSLVLSFLSMLGCIVASKIIRYAKIGEKVKRRLPRYVIYTLITSFVVLCFTSFAVMIYFGEISVFSPISNLVLVPIFTGFIYFAPFLLILCGIPYVSVPFVFLTEHATAIIEGIIGYLARIRGVSVPIYGFWQTLGLFGVFAVFLVAMTVRRKYLVKTLAMLSVFVVCFLIGTAANFTVKQTNTYISAFNYNNGDYLVLENEGKLSVIDVSKAKRSDRNFAASISGAFGYSEIESYVLCNYSKTAPEYIETVVSWNIVRELYLPNPQDDEEVRTCAEITKIAQNEGIRVVILDEIISLGDTELEIKRMKFDRSVYDSVSISGKINKTDFSYFGASSYEAFDYFTEMRAPNADIVVFGESGPKYTLEYSYNLDSVDCAVYMGDSYNFASDKVKNATQDKEFFLDDDYVRIKVADT